MSGELTIEYIDVYAPSGNGPINQWVEAIVSGNQPMTDSEIYHWVHIRDAESAHRTLSAHGIKGHFQLCGRRAWTQEMVTDEIRRLWTRFQNSIEHSHTIDSLSETPSPAAVQYSGTDGWRPMTAMRVGLMECIAHSFEQI